MGWSRGRKCKGGTRTGAGKATPIPLIKGATHLASNTWKEIGNSDGKRLLFAINVLWSTCSGVWGMKVSTVWNFLSCLLTPLLAPKLRSCWIPPISGRLFGECCSDLCNLRLKFNSPSSRVCTLAPPLREHVACFGHRGDVTAVREQISVFPEDAWELDPA